MSSLFIAIMVELVTKLHNIPCKKKKNFVRNIKLTTATDCQKQGTYKLLNYPTKLINTR